MVGLGAGGAQIWVREAGQDGVRRPRVSGGDWLIRAIVVKSRGVGVDEPGSR